MFRKLVFGSALALSSLSLGLDIPGGLGHTGETVKPNTYELVVSPAYVMSPTGAYLTSEMRYQVNEDLGSGFSFGAGEVGWNFGGNVAWHILPDTGTQPAVGVLGGAYFNRLEQNSYFVVKIAPFVSKSVKVDWGTVTPYGGVHVAPSFRLNQPLNQISLKASGGTQFALKSLSGLRFWTEAGLGIANSVHEVVVGVSYPFNALAE